MLKIRGASRIRQAPIGPSFITMLPARQYPGLVQFDSSTKGTKPQGNAELNALALPDAQAVPL
jgi:hypothetical protein